MNNKELFPLERNRYFYGKLLTTRDFEIEQNYYNNKRRLINRCVLGVGVACGLGVYPNDDTSISIEAGVALDYLGREIVLPNAIVRKLQMLEGYESLDKHDTAYLCMRYKEVMTEPVNQIGVVELQGDQYNKVKETYQLCLDTQSPPYEVLYGQEGINTVTRLYEEEGVVILQVLPKVVKSGDAFRIAYVVIKGEQVPPLHFHLTMPSDFVKDEKGELVSFSYDEDLRQKKLVQVVDQIVYAAPLGKVKGKVRSNVAVLEVGIGDRKEQRTIQATEEIHLCSNETEYKQTIKLVQETLENRVSGEDVPIYLAKIDYISARHMHFIQQITPLPFEQLLTKKEQDRGSSLCSQSGLRGADIVTEVEQLAYWQKPQVRTSYNDEENQVTFHFGMPSTEAYDYATSSGKIQIPLTGALRVNSRYMSAEIPHNLGIGDVSIQLAVEYGDAEDRKLLFGNGDVFAVKGNKEVPKVDVGAILYPDRGTFLVGVWCLDYVEGSFLTVKWFAYKPTRDTAKFRERKQISLQVVPDVHRLHIGERVRFQCSVKGTEDTTVTWRLRAEGEGSLDDNGWYQAPSQPGTYEVIATSQADPNVEASGFVIVEG